MALEPQGGVVPRQAVQPVGAAVSGLVVEARHASEGQPVVRRPETGGGVSVTMNKSELQDRDDLRGCGVMRKLKVETHLPSRERCRLPW